MNLLADNFDFLTKFDIRSTKDCQLGVLNYYVQKIPEEMLKCCGLLATRTTKLHDIAITDI